LVFPRSFRAPYRSIGLFSGSAIAFLSRQGRIPLWVKILYTGFMCVLVPYYWHDYGPTNFLYF